MCSEKKRCDVVLSVHLHCGARMPLASKLNTWRISALLNHVHMRTDGRREGRRSRGARVDHAGLRKWHEDDLPPARRGLTRLTSLALSGPSLWFVTAADLVYLLWTLS